MPQAISNAGASIIAQLKQAQAGKYYDPLDTNKDGVVSEAERMAGEMKAAQKSGTTAGQSIDQLI